MFEFCKTQIAFLQTLRQDRRAVTALEYGMIAALVSAALVTLIGKYTTGLTTMFTSMASRMTGI